MLTQLPNPPLTRWRSAIRGIATLLGGWALGEPVAVLPKRSVDWLEEVDRRERLRQAERDGDHATLDRELARAQLSQAELTRPSTRATPLADWPDEDVDALFRPPSDRAAQTSV